jgi:hypothetical protein
MISPSGNPAFNRESEGRSGVSHLSEADIELFLTGRLKPVENRRVVRHLLTDCGPCQKGMAAQARPLLDLPGEPPPGPAFGETLYDSAFDRATSAVRRRIPRWQREGARREELLVTPPEKLLALCGRMRSNRRDWALVEALLAVSHEERFRNPDQMRVFAGAAVTLAGSLDTARYGPALCKDLEARACAELANAERLCENTHKAEQALGWAIAFWEEGTCDSLTMARLLDVEASLRIDQRRLGEALDLLDLLHATYLDLGETHLAGRALVSKGINTGYDGRPHDAVRLLREGLGQIDRQCDPQLAAVGQYALLYSLVDCGECRKARRLLLESGLRQAFAEEPLNLLKLRWLEGKIYAGLDRPGRTEEAFQEVRQGFLIHALDYEAALAGLELTGVWLRQGRAGEARQLAEEILKTFVEMDVQPEALKAVRHLESAIRQQTATPLLVRNVLRFLQRLEWEPRLRFGV